MVFPGPRALIWLSGKWLKLFERNFFQEIKMKGRRTCAPACVKNKLVSTYPNKIGNLSKIPTKVKTKCSFSWE